MFEIVETTRKLEMQLEAIEYLEQLSQFTFTETSSDVPITYYIAGYVSQGLMNHLKCKEWQPIVSDNSCPLTVDIEHVTCNFWCISSWWHDEHKEKKPLHTEEKEVDNILISFFILL